jgi:translation initiation factor 1
MAWVKMSTRRHRAGSRQGIAQPGGRPTSGEPLRLSARIPSTGASHPLDFLKDLEKELGFEDELAVAGSRVRIFVDSRRYGKQVTVLEGFDPSLDLDVLARDLKKSIGTGGTSRERTIELQGDHRHKVKDYLAKRGFKLA